MQSSHHNQPEGSNSNSVVSGLGAVQAPVISEEIQQQKRDLLPSSWAYSLSSQIMGPLESLFERQEEMTEIAKILEVVPHKDLPRGGSPLIDKDFDSFDSPSAIWLICEAKALLGRPVVDEYVNSALKKLFTPEYCEYMKDCMTYRPRIGDRRQLLVGEPEQGKANAALKAATLTNLWSNGMAWKELWKFDSAPGDSQVFSAQLSSSFGRDHQPEGVMLQEMKGKHICGGHLSERVWVP